MSTRLPRSVAIGLRFVFAFVVLGLLFREVSFAKVVTALGRADPAYVVPALAMALLVHGLASARLALLARQQRLGLSGFEVFAANTAARFYSLFLPGGTVTAGAIRLVKLADKRRDYAGAAVAMAVDRTAATQALCLVGILFWFADRPVGAQPYLAVLVVGLGSLTGLVLVLAWSSRWPFVSKLEGWATRLGVGNLDALRRAVARTPEVSLPALAGIALASCLAQVAGSGAYLLLAQALGTDPSLAAIGWVRSVVILATMLPVTIAGLGLREGALLALAGFYGAGPDQALAFALLVFAVTVVAVGLVGGLFEAWRLLGPRPDCRTLE